MFVVVVVRIAATAAVQGMVGVFRLLLLRKWATAGVVSAAATTPWCTAKAAAAAAAKQSSKISPVGAPVAAAPVAPVPACPAAMVAAFAAAAATVDVSATLLLLQREIDDSTLSSQLQPFAAWLYCNCRYSCCGLLLYSGKTSTTQPRGRSLR